MLLDPVVWVPPAIMLERAERARHDRSFANEDEARAERAELSPLAPPELIDEEFREHLVQGEDGRLRFRYSQAAVVAASASSPSGRRTGSGSRCRRCSSSVPTPT